MQAPNPETLLFFWQRFPESTDAADQQVRCYHRWRQSAKKIMFGVQKIVSGGQTGADRAALDWAIANNVPHDGWCPNGRLAEDGKIDSKYQLKETPDPNYAQRTAWNVRDSDATIIFSIAEKLSGGSAFTEHITRDMNRPCLHVSEEHDGVDGAAKRLKEFLDDIRPKVLNIAGPRVSNEPEIREFVHDVFNTLTVT